MLKIGSAILLAASLVSAPLILSSPSLAEHYRNQGDCVSENAKAKDNAAKEACKSGGWDGDHTP